MTTIATSSAPDTGARRRSRTSVAGGVGYHTLSSVLAVAFLFPLIWAALNSFRSDDEAASGSAPWLPHSWSLANYRNLATYGEGIATYAFNSVLLSALVVGGTVMLSVFAGYGFSRFEFRGKKLIFAVTLGILMVPYATILLPLYIILGKVHLQNSLIGLALVLVMFQLPFGVYMMRNSFDAVPRELEEAAMVDGASNLGALRRVSLRLAFPGVVTVVLFSFLASWNEFLAPLIFLQDGSKYTLPIMLVNIRSGGYGVIDFGALQAGVVVAILPCLVVYLALQRFYVSGLLNGALRG